MTAAISTVDHRMENDADSGAHPKAFPATLRHRRCFAADDSPATTETFHHKRSQNSPCRCTGICSMKRVR